MRTLASVLEAAIQRSAAEVTLESEQPVIYRTARGSEAEQDILRRPDLFDMLAAAVSDEHQVELMLGNAIEFEFRVLQIEWRVRAVPGADAMVVRAERSAEARSRLSAPDELAIELDDADDFGLSLEDPPELDDPDFDLDGPMPPPRAATTRRPASLAPTLTDDPIDSVRLAKARAPNSEPAPAAFESGTWALEDDDDTDFSPDAHARTLAMPASDSTPAGRIPRKPSSKEPNFMVVEAEPMAQVEARRGARSEAASFASRRTVNDAPALGVDFIGVPADDDDEAPRRRSSAKLAAVRSVGQGRTISEMRSLASSEAETQREISALGSPEAETHRELDALPRAPANMVAFAADLDLGSLVYLLDAGLAEQIADSLQAPAVLLDDETEPTAQWSRELGPGSIVIVKREDPSVLLGWILRRLEQGCRVFLDTRARSPEGARRILLGTSASARAEAWLDQHPQLVVEPSETGPRVRAARSTT